MHKEMEKSKLKKIKEIKRAKSIKSISAILVIIVLATVIFASNAERISKFSDNALKGILGESVKGTSTLNNSSASFSMLSDEEITQVEEKVQIVNGDTFSAILKPDGTVWTWGNNNYGQLGNEKNENVNQATLTQVVGINGEGYLENIKQISAGRYSLVALTNDGKVVTWGYNGYGQLGKGTTGNSSFPVYVVDEQGTPIENIKQISAGANHMLALKENGEVYAWGLNSSGQLGISVSSTTSSNDAYKKIYAVSVLTSVEQGETTEYVNLSNVKQISAGADFSVVLTNDGEVYTFGISNYGQLGYGKTANSNVPVKVDIEDIIDIKAGGLQTIALKQDGTVWAWGMNRYGNLGIATSSTSSSNAAYKKTSPVQVLIDTDTPLTNVEKINSKYETSYAITKNGEIYGWGLNTSGEIGDNTLTNKNKATRLKTNGGKILNPL